MVDLVFFVRVELQAELGRDFVVHLHQYVLEEFVLIRSKLGASPYYRDVHTN